MKKILAIALALCLTLSLAVTAFANNSPSLSPEIPEEVNPGNGVSTGSEVVNDSSYGATNADGSFVRVSVSKANAGPEAADLADIIGSSEAIAGVWKITSIVGDNGEGTLNLPATGIDSSKTYEVWQDDGWELVEGATVKFDGNRVLITMNLSSLKADPFIALVEADKVAVSTPSDTTEQQGDDEGDDTVDLGDTEEPAKEENPKTGLALAVVPMAVAAAAIVVSKRR